MREFVQTAVLCVCGAGLAALAAACAAVRLRAAVAAARRRCGRPLGAAGGAFALAACAFLTDYAANKTNLLERISAAPAAGGKATARTAGGGTPTDNDADDDAAGARVVPTNTLHIAGFAVTETGVLLRVAWPEGMFADGAVIDVFTRRSLADGGWEWTACAAADGGTEASFALARPQTDGAAASAAFYRASERASAASGMGDADGDGIPDVYERAHGTNPYVADAALVPRLTVGAGGRYATVWDALAASGPYAVLSLAPGNHRAADAVRLPPHPVMLACEDGYAVFDGAAAPAVFLLRGGQEGGHMLFRNVYVNLAATSNLQAAFWCGGGLPWEGPGAAAVFENVHVRAPNPGVEAFGWLFYGTCAATAALRRCSVNAFGAAWTHGVFGDNPPPLVVESCSFVNFPQQTDRRSVGIGLRSTRANGAAAATPPVAVSRTFFDASFTNALPLARFENGGGFTVRLTDCLMPSAPVADAAPDVAENLLVTNSPAAWTGHPLAGSPAAVLGIGALPAVTPEADADADGDGLSDYDEVHLHGTNPWAADTDGDGVSDGAEVAEGTPPLDRRGFCFVCTARVANADPVHTNGCCAYLADGVLLPPVRTFTGTADVEMPHVTVADGAVPRVVAWIDVNANGVPDPGEPAATNRLKVSGHAVSVSLDLVRRDTDGDRDGMPDVWEVLHGLDPADAADARLDPDGDGLVNLHEFWAGCDPHVPDGSNTLISVLSRSVDDRIIGCEPANALAKFDNYVANGQAGVFATNANFWAQNIDTSCASMWNSADGNRRAGTVIGKRHVILAAHYPLDTNTRLCFCGTDGHVYTNTVTGLRTVAGTDICIGLLQDELPDAVAPACFLPSDFSDYIGDGVSLPAIRFDQDERCSVCEVSLEIPSLVTYGTGEKITEQSVRAQRPSNLLRASFHINARLLDSGNPMFFVVGGTPVLLGALHGGVFYPNSGELMNVNVPFATHYADAIQTAMDELCPGYEIHYLDCSPYQRLSNY